MSCVVRHPSEASAGRKERRVVCHLACGVARLDAGMMAVEVRHFNSVSLAVPVQDRSHGGGRGLVGLDEGDVVRLCKRQRPQATANNKNIYIY